MNSPLKTLFLVTLLVLLLEGCNKKTPMLKGDDALTVYGRWITEQDNQVMLNPQSSGLISWRDKLLTLSDQSAHVSQRMRLRIIEAQKAKLTGNDMLMVLSAEVQQSCFADYLGDKPDFEALAADPDDDSILYVVTEDARGSKSMSASCRQQYQNSGSTDYPTLLVRLKLQADNSLALTHVRPLQFTADMQVGDFPNDGIEALAFGKNRTLFLGLEKDQNKHARIFSLHINQDFWQSVDFAKVQEPTLQLPKFESGNHPINGMDYYQTANGAEYLVAAARNDEALWIIDLAGQKETKILPIKFYAELRSNSQGCEGHELMDNSSIEGVAVVGETLWLINDPWKAVYTDNIQCPQNRENYQKFAPLLFNLPIDKGWFN